MRLVHGAWSFGVNATEEELETAEATMQELERIGAHSADVVARWMHVYGMHGVRATPSSARSRSGYARPPATPCCASAPTTSPATAAARSTPLPWTSGGSTTRQPPTPSSSAASTTAPGHSCAPTPDRGPHPFHPRRHRPLSCHGDSGQPLGPTSVPLRPAKGPVPRPGVAPTRATRPAHAGSCRHQQGLFG